MLRLVLVALAVSFLASTAAPQTVTRLDFGREIDDWHLFDADGDDRIDVLALFAEGDGKTTLRLATQQPDGSFTPGAPCTIEAAVALALGAFVKPPRIDVAAITPGGVTLYVHDPEKGLAPRALDTSFAGLIRAPLTGVPSLWHWPTDVDGDGRDDLLAPGEDGIVLLFGNKDGKFEAPLLLEMGGDRIVDGRSSGFLDFVRSYPRPVFSDLTGDGRLDACWFDDTGLSFRPQSRPRGFDEPTHFPLAWLSGQDATGVVEQTDVSLEDLDADGRKDLVLAKMRAQEGSITDMQTTLVVLMNQGGKTPFSRRPSAAIVVKGVIGVGPTFADVDADGHLDLVYGRYGAGLSDGISRFFGRVPVTLHVHRGGGDAPFASAPDFTLKSSVPTEDFERWGARKSLAVHEDLTGDGIADLFRLERKKSTHVATVIRGSSKDGFAIGDDDVWRHEVHDLDGVTFRRLAPGAPVSVVLARETGFEMVTTKP